MKADILSADAISIPGIVRIKATELSAPPAWALTERNLISLMEEAAPMLLKKYAEPGGALYFADDLDDLYERIYNWGLFYAMGADERLLELALQCWNASTRITSDEIVHRKHPRFSQQVHREYYNLAQPGAAEWHHLGEGNMAFYDFGVASPTISENVRRAKQFAAMSIGEDPQAPNYDPKYKVFRSPVQTSRGPCVHPDLQHLKAWLAGRMGEDPSKAMGMRSTLYPIVKELESNWYEHPQRRDEISKLFEQIVLNGDVAHSLGATALVTNAYLYTGDEKYKQWVLEYTEAWLDRIKANNGIIPDNVGPTGKIGEHRQGQWWGGLYGWNSYWAGDIMFNSIIVGAECALLLTGDFGYLELLRSQIKLLMDNAITRDDGQRLVPTRYGPDGWEAYKPMRMKDLAHLYHASMDPQDYELITRVREGDVERDWNHVMFEAEKNNGNTEYGRFQYYDGKNPDWPQKILDVEYEGALAVFEEARNDTRDVETIIADNQQPPHFVLTKGLTQVMLGAPQAVYTGGLLRATVRYFDPDRARPGVPEDVAALVDKLGSDMVGVQLVNLSRTETRNVIIQAGAFGEHQFTKVQFQETDSEGSSERVVPVEAKFFAVELLPSTTIRLEVGMHRFANSPSYAFPWHGDKIPVPFQ